jgi:hypothetical protein
VTPNQALQRTAAGRRGCNRRVSWPPSLSLGRYPGEDMTTLSLSPAYREAVKVALALQVLTTLVLLTILDGGTLAKAGGAAMVGFVASWIRQFGGMCKKANSYI